MVKKKRTYRLDDKTVKRIEEYAKLLEIPKVEVLRMLISLGEIEFQKRVEKNFEGLKEKVMQWHLIKVCYPLE